MHHKFVSDRLSNKNINNSLVNPILIVFYCEAALVNGNYHCSKSKIKHEWTYQHDKTQKKFYLK